MAKKYREVWKIMQRHGWVRARQTGSHEIWVHKDGRRAAVPGGGKAGREVPVGTLASIRRRTGIEELR